MIHSLTIRDPNNTPVSHWNKVPFLKGQEKIEFKPGMNILFGRNGSGKSTLISALAMLLHCYNSNWPLVNRDSVFNFNKKYLADGLLLEHDGAPARYMGLEEIATAPDKSVEKVDIQLGVEKATMLKALHQQSAGQGQITRLQRFFATQPQKVRASLTRASIGKDFHDLYDVATESLKNVKKTKGEVKQQVIILDEVDKSLDFARQSKVWNEIDRLLETGEYQFIIASHSPWAAKYKNANYIETEPGYLAATRTALNLLLSDFKSKPNEQALDGTPPETKKRKSAAA